MLFPSPVAYCAETVGTEDKINSPHHPRQSSEREFFLNRPHIKKNTSWGFPGGAVVGNPPANAEHTGSSPGLGGSHMPRSGWARKPQLLSLRIWSLCSATRQPAIVRGPRTAMKSGPRLPQLEKALAQKRRPNTAINFKKRKKKYFLKTTCHNTLKHLFLLKSSKPWVRCPVFYVIGHNFTAFLWW